LRSPVQTRRFETLKFGIIESERRVKWTKNFRFKNWFLRPIPAENQLVLRKIFLIACFANVIYDALPHKTAEAQRDGSINAEV